MRTAKSIDIVFENTEFVNVNAEDIGHFHMENIHTDISRLAVNAIEEMNVCDTLMMELLPSADKASSDLFPGSAKTLFERLRLSQDITSLEIHWKDGSSSDIYVTWSEEDEYSNTYQRSWEKNGSMYIVISKDNTAPFLFLDILQEKGKS